MDKNNKIKNKPYGSRWSLSSPMLKTFFVPVSLFILLSLAILIIVKQYPKTESGSFKPSLTKLMEASRESSVFSQEEKEALLNQLNSLKDQVNNQPQVAMQLPNKLIGLELLNAVLEGRIPLEKFKKFLQTHPESWAQSFSKMLDSIKESQTYAQLENLLGKPSAQKLSIWGRIKRKMKSLIHIRKLDDKGNYVVGEFEDIRKALRGHDIRKAIGIYEKLPVEEKARLILWKEAANARLTLETIANKLLIELTES